MNHLKKLFPYLLFLLVVGISVRPLLANQFFRVHDFTHGARVVEMFRGFQDGQIPVRWSKNFGYGYGMPTFLFYAPLPYIIGSFFYWITENLVFSLKIIWAVPSILSFVGMYLFTKKHVGRLGALVAATAFTLAPYRAVDLYVRGALGEIWGIALFPWVLWSIDQWFIERKKIDIKMIFLVTCLFLSHNLMALFFIPVMGSYLLVKWLTTTKRKVSELFYLSLQMILAFGCSAFYLLPAFLEKNVTKFDEKILTGYFDYSLHFLYLRQYFQENWQYGGSSWGPDDDISFFLGYGQLIGLGFLTILLVRYLFRFFSKNKTSFKQKLNRLFIYHSHRSITFAFSGVFLAIALFLAIQKSKFIWDRLEILQIAQFPWRFLSLSILFLAALLGYIFRFSVSQKVRLGIASVILVSLTLPAIKYFQPEKYLDDPSAFYYTDETRIRTQMSETWVDFLPKQFNEKIGATELRFHTDNPASDTQAELLVDRSHQMLVRTNFTALTTLTFHVGAFPGWQASIQGQKVEYQQSKDGLIELAVPSGEHLVGLTLERTKVQLFADLISVIALSGVIASQIIVSYSYKVMPNDHSRK